MKLDARRKFLHLAGAAVVATAVMPAFAAEQPYPTRAIRAVVPFLAGSAIDIIARIAGDALSAQLGQQIVVDNRSGAGGTIGSYVVAQAEPDGYTVIINSSAHSIAPAVYPKASYDAVKDFAAVVSFGSIPNVAVIAPGKGVKTLQEMVTFAKKEKRTYASSGVGSSSHWAMERLRLSAGFEAIHVPFKGGPEAIREVITGRVDFMSFGIASVLPYIREGRFIALAVSTPKRSSVLPDVPTTLECGYPDSEIVFWNGLLVPKKTPRAIVNRLYEASVKALETQSMKEKLAPFGTEPMPMTPTEFDEYIRKEVAMNLGIVKAANLKFD